MRAHRTTAAVAAACLTLAVAGAAAGASGTTSNACGEGFEQMSVKQVLKKLAAPGFADSIMAMDENGNDLLCVKVLPNGGGPPQFDPAFIYLDDKG